MRREVCAASDATVSEQEQAVTTVDLEAAGASQSVGTAHPSVTRASSSASVTAGTMALRLRELVLRTISSRTFGKQPVSVTSRHVTLGPMLVLLFKSVPRIGLLSPHTDHVTRIILLASMFCSYPFFSDPPSSIGGLPNPVRAPNKLLDPIALRLASC